MATAYPTALDTSTQQPSPSASTEMDDAGFLHDEVHTNASGALIALETKLGIGSTTAAGASTNHVLVKQGDGDTEWAAAPSSVPTTITVADTTNTTCSVALFEDATGDLAPKSDAGATYNAATGVLTATGFAGPLTGNVTGNASGSAGSATGNAATATALETARDIGGVSFDGTGNITLPGVNSSGNQNTSGSAATLTTARNIGGVSFNGSAAIVPGTITVADTTNTTCSVALFEDATGDLAPKTDGGATYNAGTGTLTATAFAGPLTGNVTGNASGTAATVTGAAQTNITSVGTLSALAVTGAITAGSLVAPLVINPQTGTTYTLALADAGKMITSSNGSAQTITVPPTGTGGGEVNFPIGTQIIIQNIGSANATLAEGAGVDIFSKDDNKEIDGQYAAATLIQTATSDWSLIGALA